MQFREQYNLFRSRLISCKFHFEAEQIRKQAYAYLLDQIRQGNIPNGEIGEWCHLFLYLEQVENKENTPNNEVMDDEFFPKAYASLGRMMQEALIKLNSSGLKSDPDER